MNWQPNLHNLLRNITTKNKSKILRLILAVFVKAINHGFEHYFNVFLTLNHILRLVKWHVYDITASVDNLPKKVPLTCTQFRAQYSVVYSSIHMSKLDDYSHYVYYTYVIFCRLPKWFSAGMVDDWPLSKFRFDSQANCVISFLTSLNEIWT